MLDDFNTIRQALGYRALIFSSLDTGTECSIEPALVDIQAWRLAIYTAGATVQAAISATALPFFMVQPSTTVLTSHPLAV